MIAERDARWSRAAQVGMLMRVYRETFELGGRKPGLTQAGLLQRMSEVNGQYAEKYSHVTVSRWESGATLPTEERLRDFGLALNLAPIEVEGLMILAGFRQGSVSERSDSSDRWTDGGVGVGAVVGQRIQSVSVGETGLPSSSDRSAEDSGTGAAVPDMGSIIRYLSYKCVLTGVGIAAVGYALAAFGWNNSWMPVVYVVAMMSLVAAQGLLHRGRPHGLGEFYSTTVFFMLSTFLLQSAFIRMDPYGFYTLGDYAGTHLPYLLALEVNLALASIAGLAFHLLRQWQYSGDPRRSNPLRRAVTVTLPPTLFAYASIVVFSNISLWIQLVIVLPPLAGVFMVLLVLRDPAVRPSAEDRRFALVTAIALSAIMGSLGAGVVVTAYLAPNIPSVLPDHNWWTSWGIDYGQLGYPQGEVLERLNLGYLWHGLATFFYIMLVVGGVLISSIHRIGRNDGAMASAPRSLLINPVYEVIAAWTRRIGSMIAPGRQAHCVGRREWSRKRSEPRAIRATGQITAS